MLNFRILKRTMLRMVLLYSEKENPDHIIILLYYIKRNIQERCES